jgi:hypothetical protein
MELEQPEVIQDSAADQGNSTPAAETANSQTDDDLDAGLLDDEQQTDDEIEDELEGLKVRGKKELIEKIKAERLMQADYTRKTQEVAAQRKEIESRQAQIAQQMEMAQQFADELGAAKAIDMRLAQYAQVNWEQLEQADPAQAMRLQREMRDLQAQRAQVAHSIATKHQQRTLAEQQAIAKQIQEGNEVLTREIKGWGPEKANEVRSFAASLGYSEQQIAGISDPRLVRVLHDAMTLNKLRENAKKRDKPAPQEAPVTRLSAQKTAQTRDPEKMSADEWVKWRESQLKRK